ncbi:riboflavin synthase [Ammonifex thiophilus]|uniref:Riboflavin synthase n=1 Tax=Ammonifex thiophilus TaxID=444093 RepID=A0A3D8P8A5_9THEO|nr:riboflavin synthase [Ammonifex thiophilus]RDV84721.1 riboflavin synthase [Ammonifex thiophilus]
MFTGLVEEVGRVRRIVRGPASAQLEIEARRVLEDLRVGDSVAVNGACLTVTRLGSGSFWADAMAETLRRTNLGELGPGDRVNLERALRLGDRLGGHLVTGHVDGVGRILRKEREDVAWVLSIAAPSQVTPYLIEKGSVAVDGVSLTVVEVKGDIFKVALIPHTADHTVLGSKGPGDKVNLEADLIGKYVRRFLEVLQEKKEGITWEFLRNSGFTDV